MATENIIAALDIGTTKIVCLVAEMDQDGGIYIIGHGMTQSEGLRRGIVVDMEKTIKSIRKAVDDAQMISGTEIDRVTVGIAGEHIRSINSNGVVAVSRSDNEISGLDVEKAISAAKAIAIPVDRDIVHVIPQEYSVDDTEGIKDPVGMSGVRLEVEAHIVTASITSAKNIMRALERCQLGVDHLVLESLALSKVLLTESELDDGIILVDLGGDITNISVFYNGAIRFTSVVSLGGKNVTNDIAIGLRTSVDQAEAIKLAHGASLASQVDAEEMITISGIAGKPNKEISRNVLASIIEPRMEEIFSHVSREIHKAGIRDIPAGGIILTGGGSLLPGAADLAEQIFDMPVRVETIKHIDHIPDELNSTRFATPHGLIWYGFHNEPVKGTKSGNVKGWFKWFEEWISKHF
ncbi:MAG: cell division protein FtsA [Calditrichaeota bacterium]|nr:MAG: cell division protein FtsA [Calditrichota bacterium]